MQITHMTPSNSSDAVKTPSPVKRSSTPIQADPFQPTNSPRTREIDHKLSILREDSIRKLTPKQSPLRREIITVADGYVKNQVGEIERKTPPKTRERSESLATPRSPGPEGTPRRNFMGIAKLNSAEKKGCLIPVARGNNPPPVPRKDSVTMPPDSPKNEPLPPIPSAPTEATAKALEPTFGLISGKELLESTKALPAGSIIKPREKPPLDRGDNSSLRNLRENIRDKISRIATPNSTLRSIKGQGVFEDFVKSLNTVMTEECDMKDAEGISSKIKLRQSKYILITNSEHKLAWIKQDSESHLKDWIEKGSKSTILSVLKSLKSASKVTKNNSEIQSEILQNLARLLQNGTVRHYYDTNTKVKERVHEIHFALVYEKPYKEAKLIRNMLVLAEYNIRLMYEFLADEQERLIKKFKEIYPTPPTSSIAADSIIERLNQIEVCAMLDKQKGENIAYIKNLYEKPRELAFNNHQQKVIYDIERFLDNAFEVCSQFRKNLSYISDLQSYLEKMPDETPEKGFLTTKQRAQDFLNKYEIDSCITEIMKKHSDPLKAMVAGIPHAIRDLYKRTVTLLEDQGKIQAFDRAAYFDRIQNQTKVINDQSLELIPGTINEIVKYLPKKQIAIADRSQKYRVK